MKILFLDTETSGLSAIQDSVIEIAGVIVEIHETTYAATIISEFNSLVYLESTLDDKITRLTSITQSQLNNSKTRGAVQKLWNEWINQHVIEGELLYICGHSIQFDIGFLSNERWYIPDNTKVIDTLDLAKIFLPDSEAINLEYIIRRFKLKPEKHHQTAHKVTNLEPHRALYDTYAAFLLFKFILDRLLTLPLDISVKNIILQTFLPLPLTFYSQPIPQNTATDNTSRNKIIRIDGTEILPNLSDRIKNYGKDTDLSFIQQALEKTINYDAIRVLCQLYTMLIMRRVDSTISVRFHARERTDFLLFSIVLDLLSPEQDTSATVTVRYLEDAINKIQTISNHSFRLGSLIQEIELYTQFNQQNLPKDTKNNIMQLISSYDFLLLSIQPLIRYGECRINPLNSDPETLQVIQRIQELEKQIAAFSLPESLFSHPINEILQSRIQKLCNEFSFDVHKKYTFRVSKGEITMTWEKYGFTTQEYFNTLSTSYPQVEFETHLSKDSLPVIQKLLGINTSSFSYSTLSDPAILNSLSNTPIRDYIRSLSGSDKPSIIVSGQNSAYKLIENILIKEYGPKDFLIVGESGSLSKVVSKITKDFTGIILLKVPELDYIINYGKQFDISSLSIVLPPYLFIRDYYSKLSSIESNTLRELHRESICNKFYSYWHQPITFIESIT
jgi:DNA polymerase III epsilon subunit-like protein